MFARRANPPPPSLLSETLRHQKWLCQAQIYYETFQSPSYKHGLRKCFGTLAVQACFREHRAIKNRTHLNPFRTMEGAAAPNPHFLGCASLLSRASRPQQQNHFHNPYMPCVCKWEGGLPPLTPPTFLTLQAWIQEHRAIKTNCVKHRIRIDLFGIVYAIALELSLCKLALGSIAPSRTEPLLQANCLLRPGFFSCASLLRNPCLQASCLQFWGDCFPPSPAAFLSRASLVSTTSRHQHRTLMEPFKVHHIGIVYATAWELEPCMLALQSIVPSGIHPS